MRLIIPECNVAYTIVQEETRNFSTGWYSTGPEDDLDYAFQYKRYVDTVLYMYVYVFMCVSCFCMVVVGIVCCFDIALQYNALDKMLCSDI